jgi:hypothetical protein
MNGLPIPGDGRQLARVQPQQRVQQGGHVRQPVGGEAVQVSRKDLLLHVCPLQGWPLHRRQEPTLQGKPNSTWGSML